MVVGVTSALTERQRAIWRLVALGLTYHQICDKLGIGYSVVRKEINDLHRFTGARSAVDLTHVALDCGIISDVDRQRHAAKMKRQQEVIAWG